MDENIKLDSRNYRIHGEENKRLIRKSLSECGAGRSIVIDKDNVMIAGEGVYEQAKELGLKVRIIESDGKELIAIKRTDLSTEDEKRKLLAFADNHTSDTSKFDFSAIVEDFGMDVLDDWSLDIDADFKDTIEQNNERVGSLKKKFIIPPFSILDTKLGQWQERKRAWLDLGIKSEEGRGGNITYARSSQSPHIYEIRNQLRAKTGADPSWDELTEYCTKNNIRMMDGTSIFDPVLCELAYRWFNVDGGIILDPFAGGSVRGIVAARLGYHYYGVDLRSEQIKANYENAAQIHPPFTEDECPVWKCGDSCDIDRHFPELKVDLVFSCPPYADLEIYSDDPKDLSTMKYNDFKKAYFTIIRKSCAKLKENRFAVFVVGEVRDKNGAYRGFVPDTIKAFQDAGLSFYNEMILANQIGSLAMRVGNQFNNSRKIGKHHQNVLVFYKGDVKKIRDNYSALDLSYCDSLNEEDDDGTKIEL